MEISKETIAVVQERDVEDRVALLTKLTYRQLHLFGVFKHWWEFVHLFQDLCHHCQKPQGMRVEETKKILEFILVLT